MSVRLLLCALLAAAPDGGIDAPKRNVSVVKPAVRAPPLHGSKSQCASCHATSGWSDVRFNHDRTGYPLTGRHAVKSCKGCHTVDFTAPLPRSCQGCHRDVHAGELGARCEGCHDTDTWASRFDADAHRNTNFPLLGSHAAVPCVECHAEARERRFSRSAVDCASCHLAATLRTQGTAVDHSANALSFAMRPCQECHLATRWSPARFPSHDHCFPLSAGPHAAVPCLSCHSGLAPAMAACRTGTATLCINCHTNSGLSGNTSHTDAQHADVPGYVFSASKCAQCHAGTDTGAP